MKTPDRKLWIAGGVLVAVACIVLVGFMFFGGSHSDSMDAPKGSVYYKGQMAADIESAAHDPRNKKPGSSPPAGRK